MAVLKSTLMVLLAMSSQVLALPATPTTPTELPPTKLQPPYHPAHNTPAEVDPIKPATTVLPVVDQAARHTPAEVVPTEPAPTISAASTATAPSPAPSNPKPPTVKSSPSLPLPPAPAAPSAFDLAPDPMDKFMIGMPTYFCNYRFQLSGKEDHYFLRGRNWNITGKQLEEAVTKVVFNTPEWGISPKGGPDRDGKFKPGNNSTRDTIAFKYSETYVKDENNTVKGVQEFAAEWYIPEKPLTVARDLEVEFERMLVDRPMYTARRTVGIHCGKLDDEDSPLHSPEQPSHVGKASNATVEVLLG